LPIVIDNDTLLWWVKSVGYCYGNGTLLDL